MSTTGTEKPDVTVKQLAEKLKVDPRDLRKWLRSEGMGLGQRGKRYAFNPQEAGQVTRKWKAAHKDNA